MTGTFPVPEDEERKSKMVTERQPDTSGTRASMRDRRKIRRWRRYLANERAEAAVYRELARKKTGEESEILSRLADAEARHEEYWRNKLGDDVGMPVSASLPTRMLGFMASRFGSVFVLALIQSAETRSPYTRDEDASEQIAADEHIHAEVVRGLATNGRESMSGNFRAAIFGANDGLVSNLALVLGVMGTGVPASYILITGLSGLFAGAFSMAAGEYVSVRSQSELLDASAPDPGAADALPQLDVDANELALVYRARGMSEEESEERARESLHLLASRGPREAGGVPENFIDGHDHIRIGKEGSDGAISAAVSSFLCFAVGAFIPVLPFLFGAPGVTGGIIALILVGLALVVTGGLTGVLSGKPPLWRSLRQLAIGLGAAAVTWSLGSLVGILVG